MLNIDKELPFGMRGKISYRPEIDGLRAIAVVLVVLFHAGFDWMPGGYIGVDIFFVISGYLITRLMLAEMAAGEFSFARFYGRRVRRLAPALLATIFLTILGAATLFSISDFERLGTEVMVALVGISNFYYSGRGDYFTQATLHYPLLHTWSLAVEEQYYLVAPLTAFLTYKFFHLRGVLLFSVLLLLLSLAVAQFVLIDNAKIAFYWPLFRIWEFLLGALVLFVPRIASDKQVASTLALFTGLAMIIASAVLFDKSTAVPGWPALLPCVATGLILFGVRAGGTSWLITNPLLVGTGLISYSLYLVHWPVMVLFAYARSSPELLAADRIPAIAISILISLFMYFVIERRFRAKKNMEGYLTNGSFALNCGFVAIALAIVASSMLWANGWAWRLKTPYAPSVEGYGICKRSLDCKLGKAGQPDVILVGDSHAKHLATGFDFWAENQAKSAVLLTAPSCGIPLGMKTTSQHRTKCMKLKKLLVMRLKNSPQATIMLAQRWRGYGKIEVVSGALETFLKKHETRKIVLIGQMPQPRKRQYLCGNIPSYVFSVADCEARFQDKTASKYNLMLEAVANKFENVEFADPGNSFCDEGICRGVIGRNAVFSDSQHITEFTGKHLFTNLFAPLLK